MSSADLNRKIMAVELLRPDPNYFLHGALTFLTGLWGFVWIAVALKSRAINKQLDRQIEEIRTASSEHQHSTAGHQGPSPAAKDNLQ